MDTSKLSIKPLYVYSQAFGKDWVTVGAFFRGSHGQPGKFKYAPSYLERSDRVSIDPVNLPNLNPGHVFLATRYGGLHDVLRDACPDSWGRKLLIQHKGLKENSLPLDFLKATDNSDRWGALAVGNKKTASLSEMLTPKAANLDQVIAELQALEKGAKAINPSVRRRLIQTSSGGARPKVTIVDAQGDYWLLKPQSMFDPPQTTQLEHFAQQWGSAMGLSVAQTNIIRLPSLIPAVLVKRFDRENGYRKMCVSAASLLKYEFPPDTSPSHAPTKQGPPSYPGLASQMKLIGCPEDDRHELFRRMIFNMICGNDDDHVRNHALVYNMTQNAWRLSPAYDLVPSQSGPVTHLGMGVSVLDKRISKENVLSSFEHFGFKSKTEAEHVMQETFDRAAQSYALCKDLLNPDAQSMVQTQMASISKLLFLKNSVWTNFTGKGIAAPDQDTESNKSCPK